MTATAGVLQTFRVADFSKAYADQSEQDHAVLKKAVRSGRLEVINEAA